MDRGERGLPQRDGGPHHPADNRRRPYMGGRDVRHRGCLAGYRSIHDVMADADFRSFIARLMQDEVAPLLPPVPGIDLAGYQQTLLERFANPKIGDQVARICTDGSDRMPKFLLPSLAEA